MAFPQLSDMSIYLMRMVVGKDRVVGMDMLGQVVEILRSGASCIFDLNDLVRLYLSEHHFVVELNYLFEQEHFVYYLHPFELQDFVWIYFFSL